MFPIRSIFSFIGLNLPGKNVQKIGARTLTVSSALRIKEIIETKNGKETVFEGKIVKAPWEVYFLKSAVEAKDACPVCSTNLDIKHTDVLILSQFVRSDGCMLPRRITGLCKTQQKRIATMVAMAQKAGLMSNLTPANSKRDPKKREKWKKFNTYYDESTICLPKEYKQKKHLHLVKLY